MDRIANGSFFRRGAAKEIKAQIVTHDSSQQLRIRSGTELRMLLWGVQRWLDRGPLRHPERAHSTALLNDLGDMSAFHEHGHTQILILNRDRFPAIEDSLWHSQLSQQLFGRVMEGSVAIEIGRVSWEWLKPDIAM
jgi:hypothetical protein